MNKPKRQGTTFERSLIERFKQAGLHCYRLAEHGIHDLGDIQLTDHHGDTWIIEARHRENMQPHRALEAAQGKVRDELAFTALIWKRSLRKKENERRTPDGVGTVVVLDLDTFIGLLQ